MSSRWALIASVTMLFLGTGAGRAERATYQRTVAAHTEELVIYKDLTTALILRATLLDEAFRAALAEERRRLLGAPPSDHAAFVARLAENASRWHEVVFSAESPALAVLPTFGGDDETWTIRLVADGRVQPLAAIEAVRAPTPLHDALYPHRTRWATLWIARFDRLDDRPTDVRLEVAGGLGRGEVRWATP